MELRVNSEKTRINSWMLDAEAGFLLFAWETHGEVRLEISCGNGLELETSGGIDV